MSFLGWMALVGTLLLVIALSSVFLRRLPVSTSLIYLACGMAIGPLGLDWLNLNLLQQSQWFERLSEVAVIVSLFVGGLKLRLSPRDPSWRAAYVLAGPVMLVSIAAVALFLKFAFGLDPALALLLGAMLAPTDPVLASSVTVNNAADQDRLRYGLSGEAGLNDGAAFPFVLLALMWIEHSSFEGWLGSWALERLLWAVPVGLLLGYVLGRLGGRLTIFLRSRHRDVDSPNDFLALALIAIAYTAAEAIHGWGFLAAFAAGVGVRSAELRVVVRNPHPEHEKALLSDEETGVHPPAEDLVTVNVGKEEMEKPAVAAGVVMHDVITFGNTLERMLEVMLVGIVGVALGTHWDSRSLLIAFALFFIIRPFSARLLLSSTPTTNAQRWFMGWFGIRGIGSLYYVSYALNHGVRGDAATTIVGLTISVVALSIVIHGASAQPLLARYEAALQRAESAGNPLKT